MARNVPDDAAQLFLAVEWVVIGSRVCRGRAADWVVAVEG
jgi:hypothetical protein